MATVLLLNGPNLNTLGTREPEIYGRTTLPEIEDTVRKRIEGAGHAFRCFQSNSEGACVDWMHQHRDADFLLLNPAGLTQFGVSLRDAIKLTDMPFIEIHLSNIHKREAFRHTSMFTDVAVGTILGLGAQGYDLAAQYAIEHLKGKK